MDRVELLIGGVRTPAWTAGDNGPGVVLLHGSADSPLAWDGVAARSRVYAPALPPLAGGLALQADLPWLDALMTETGARVLAGHSYGALLALRYALRHPGRLDRLVIAEPIAWGMGRGLPEFTVRATELETRCLAPFRACLLYTSD